MGYRAWLWGYDFKTFRFRITELFLRKSVAVLRFRLLVCGGLRQAITSLQSPGVDSGAWPCVLLRPAVDSRRCPISGARVCRRSVGTSLLNILA